MRIRLKNGIIVFLKHVSFSEDAVKLLHDLARVTPLVWLDTIAGEDVQVRDIDVSAVELRLLNATVSPTIGS